MICVLHHGGEGQPRCFLISYDYTRIFKGGNGGRRQKGALHTLKGVLNVHENRDTQFSCSYLGH
jgi:hypothetical protein